MGDTACIPYEALPLAYDKDEIAEEEPVLDIYRELLGM